MSSRFARLFQASTQARITSLCCAVQYLHPDPVGRPNSRHHHPPFKDMGQAPPAIFELLKPHQKKNQSTRLFARFCNARQSPALIRLPLAIAVDNELQWFCRHHSQARHIRAMFSSLISKQALPAENAVIDPDYLPDTFLPRCQPRHSNLHIWRCGSRAQQPPYFYNECLLHR